MGAGSPPGCSTENTAAPQGRGRLGDVSSEGCDMTARGISGDEAPTPTLPPFGRPEEEACGRQRLCPGGPPAPLSFCPTALGRTRWRPGARAGAGALPLEGAAGQALQAAAGSPARDAPSAPPRSPHPRPQRKPLRAQGGRGGRCLRQTPLLPGRPGTRGRALPAPPAWPPSPRRG